jgi:hypothetical protein
MEFNAQDELRILDDSFEQLPVEVCTDCGACLRATHDHATVGRHLGSLDFETQLLQPASHSLKYNIQYLTDDYHILLPSPQNIYIAALFAVHEGTDKDSLLQCKMDEVDLKAIRQVEAFLWALHKVNAYLLHTVNGLQLGGLLIDTCNSRVRTMMLAAGLDALNNKMKRGVNSHHILAVVNTLPLQESRAANEILSRMNITSLSTGQAAAISDFTGGRNQYIFQVCVLLK